MSWIGLMSAIAAGCWLAKQASWLTAISAHAFANWLSARRQRG
jgi:hypothetical protein